MNLLELVPAFSRQLRLYKRGSDTDSDLAGYLADAVEAMGNRWQREYVVAYTAPKTYVVTPDITPNDKRPIVLMASIIYKGSNLMSASVRDGDFSYDPQIARWNHPIQQDIDELKYLVPIQLAKAFSSPMYGFHNIYNKESYDWQNILPFIIQ